MPSDFHIEQAYTYRAFLRKETYELMQIAVHVSLMSSKSLVWIVGNKTLCRLAIHVLCGPNVRHASDVDASKTLKKASQCWN